jgi:hypothetical protein
MQDLWLFAEDLRLMKTQNKERQVFRRQPLSAKAWVHSQVSLFMV